MEIKKNDFVEIDFDLYANGNLVQTTDKAKGTKANLKQEKYGPQTMIVGYDFMLKALDEDILKHKQGSERILELESKDAYGPRRKDFIKIIPKSAFDEHKTRPVVGVVYDFNGMFGIVKSVIGGRIMVDFNNPLAGKDIKIVYKIKSKIEAMDKQVSFILENVLKMPANLFSVKLNEKELILAMPEQLIPIKDQILKTIEEYSPQIKDYSVKIENFKKQ